MHFVQLDNNGTRNQIANQGPQDPRATKPRKQAVLYCDRMDLYP